MRDVVPGERFGVEVVERKADLGCHSRCPRKRRVPVREVEQLRRRRDIADSLREDGGEPPVVLRDVAVIRQVGVVSCRGTAARERQVLGGAGAVGDRLRRHDVHRQSFGRRPLRSLVEHGVVHAPFVDRRRVAVLPAIGHRSAEVAGLFDRVRGEPEQGGVPLVSSQVRDRVNEDEPLDLRRLLDLARP